MGRRHRRAPSGGARAQSETLHVLRPLETFTSSRPFFALKSSTAASASFWYFFGLMAEALTCQAQKSPPRTTASCGTKYVTAAITHLTMRLSMRKASGLGEATAAALRAAPGATPGAAQRAARAPRKGPAAKRRAAARTMAARLGMRRRARDAGERPS